MKVIAIEILRWNGEAEPTYLSLNADLSSFGFFKRGTVQEVLRFLTRTVAKRTPPGERNIVEEGDYVCYCYVSPENLVSTVVTDKEYPPRVALSLLGKALDEFKASCSNWRSFTADTQLDIPALTALLTKYQEPEKADPILSIKKDLEETKVVLHKSIEDLLARGEKLEALAEKSSDLSASSAMFLKQAKKTNSCCKTW